MSEENLEIVEEPSPIEPGEQVQTTFVCGQGNSTSCQGIFQHFVLLGLPPEKFALVKMNQGYVLVKADQMERV